MRALTIRQPWAWAIADLGKNVENRSWKTAHRGTVAIHAGRRMDDYSDLIVLPAAAAHSAYRAARAKALLTRAPLAEAPRFRLGGVVALAEIIGCHHAEDCAGSGTTDDLGGRGRIWCSPWAMPGQFHIELADVRPLPMPVPCRGALGLWRLPDDAEKAVIAQLEETNHG